MKGLILISPLLDFREFAGSSLLQYVDQPAVHGSDGARGEGRRLRAPTWPTSNVYARGDFLADLVKGEADKEATTRLADKVAALTGIDQAVTRRLAGRFDSPNFAASSIAGTAR